MDLTRELYDALERVQFDRWDAIIADDVLINSRAGRDIRGLRTLKEFAARLIDFGCRIDLIDESLALDQQGDGRGFITFILNWKHTKNFGCLQPAGWEGTSEETMLLTIRSHKIIRIDDLAIYEWEWANALAHRCPAIACTSSATA